MKHTVKWSLALLAPVLVAATSATELQQVVRDDTHSQINFSASSRMIDAKSVNTRIGMRADTKLLITGDLTIRGVTKTISVPSTLVFFDGEPSVGRVKGQFTLLRKDFVVGYDPPGNPVENEVGVQFDIAFQQPAPPRP